MSGELLQGRVAIVTGGGRGIGASVSRLFAHEGASVLVNDLGGAEDGSGSDESPARQVAGEITAAGGAAVADTTDVGDHAGGEEMIRTAIREFGKLDILVNAAGILRDRMIFNMSEAEWDDVVRVHLKGHFNTIRPAAEYWREQRNEAGHYRIINFTSVSGLHGNPGQPNYAAAKMGIVGLTYSCANALGRYGVTCNAISPGASTRLTATVPVDRRRGTLERPEMSPDNIAPVVAYLASERSDWCTGRIVHTTGYEVALYSNPEPIRRIVSTGPWELEQLGSLMERDFRAAVEGRPR